VLARRGWHDAAAVAIAVAVGAAWLAMALLGLAAFVWAHPIWWVFGGALVAGAVMLRPRPLRLGEAVDFDDPRAVVQSPAFSAGLAALAAEVGTRPPDVVFVTISPDIALVRDGLGRRRVLLVGMPLWVLLDDPARRAIVVHELGHDAYRDSRRVGLAMLAMRWLNQWSQQFGAGVRASAIDRPADELVMVDPLAAGRIVGLHGPTVIRSTSNLFDALLGGIVRAVARLLERLTFVPHQRAELQADAAAVRVAGTVGVLQLLAVLPLRRRAGLSARQALLRTDAVDLPHTVIEHVDAIPNDRREALAIAAANEEVRTDQQHLPVGLRRELVNRLPTSTGLPVPDEATWRTACHDLAATFAPLDQDLRHQAQRGRRGRHT
jgi:Zn-dependent protease with chaperone function